MAYKNIKSWSTTPASNATVGSISWAEGQAPSTVNDSARQTMADMAEFYQAMYTTFNARLTLTTAVPVTTADVTGAGTIYLTPYKGNQIWLYDGAAQWNLFNLTEISLALTLTSGKPYDVFCYDNAGTPTLEVLVWTNDTTRATALTFQNGIYVKTGATTRRYVGTIYASGTNTTEDSYAKRYVWNYANRVRRTMKKMESTGSWNYSSATLQQANASAANQIDFVRGVEEDAVTATANSIISTNSATFQVFTTSIGLDGVTEDASTLAGLGSVNSAGGSGARATWSGFPGVGRHYLTWLEAGNGTGTQTWYGTGTANHTGIQGEVFG